MQRLLIYTHILTDAEGAKLMNDLRNDALKEVFKRFPINN